MRARTNALLSTVFTLLLLTCMQGAALAELVFPDIADGGGYKTALLLVNGGDTDALSTVSFFSDSGAPLSVTIGGNTASTFGVPIQAKGSVKLTTSGSPTRARVGWALVSAPRPAVLSGNAVFQLFDASSQLLSEASVPAAPPVGFAEFYVDEADGFHTGIAMSNPGTTPAEGKLTLRNTGGEVIGTWPVSLGPGEHLARFVWELIPGATSGRAEIDLDSGALSAAALRQHTSLNFSTVSVGTSAPWTVLFSPEGGVRSRIVEQITRASESIDVAIYSFTAGDIRNALIAAKNRGVAIRIIADTGQSDGPGAEIARLEAEGFDVKRMEGTGGGIMHNKYCIIDNRVLITGSYNWSAAAEYSNDENALFLEGAPVIQDYAADFERLWQSP